MLKESLTIEPSFEDSTGNVGCVEAHCPENLPGKTLFKILMWGIGGQDLSRQPLVCLDVLLELHLIGVSSRAGVTLKGTLNEGLQLGSSSERRARAIISAVPVFCVSTSVETT